MRRCFFTIAALILSATACKAYAQALPTAVGPGKSIRIGGGYSMYHVDYGQRTLGGYQFWVDANPFWRYGVEAEMRRLRHNTDLNTYADTYLIGPRLVLLPGRFQPYVKGMVGKGKFNFPYNYAHGSYFVVAGGAGVDVRLAEHVHWRVVDVQYQKWPHFTFGPMKTMGVSTGISITIYHGTSWRSD